VWPQEVEDLLSGDLQLPGSQIDLDMFQYVRVLCAILDIPTHTNLIESLHVMFTLYLEFRANQHFQHA
jgi:intraflagellar transport protein 46